MDFATGKLAHQPVNGFHGGVVRLTYAKDDFVLRVILHAMAAETLIHLRINAAQGLEDGHRRSDGKRVLAAGSLKAARAPEAEQVKPHAAHCQPSCYQSWYKIQHC